MSRILAFVCLIVLCGVAVRGDTAPGFAKTNIMMPDSSLDTIPQSEGNFEIGNAESESAITKKDEVEDIPTGDEADDIIREEEKKREQEGKDKKLPCLDDCLGRGECINGKCECFRLYAGENCRIRIPFPAPPQVKFNSADSPSSVGATIDSQDETTVGFKVKERVHETVEEFEKNKPAPPAKTEDFLDNLDGKRF